MINIHIILLVFALVCFLFAAWQHTAPQWNRIVAAGLAAWVAASVLVR